jgi:hypothetical protein
MLVVNREVLRPGTFRFAIGAAADDLNADLIAEADPTIPEVNA